MEIPKPDPIPRKILPIIFVIDTSGCIIGTKIASVNQAMTEALKVLKEISENYPNYDFKIGILQFVIRANWVTGENGLVSLEDFVWSDLEAPVVDKLELSLDEMRKLDYKLERNSIRNYDGGYRVPVLIFMNDSPPTDDYKTALKKITATNDWFNAAVKIAIAIDNESDTIVLTKIKENSEIVSEVNYLEIILEELFGEISIPALPPDLLSSLAKGNGSDDDNPWLDPWD